MHCARTCRRLAGEGSWCSTVRWSGWCLCTDSFRCCAGTYSPATGNGGTEVNAVEYNGRWYRTLDGSTSPLSTAYTCQNYYLALPSGWALAADNADSLYVIRSYRWGTYAMVVAGGRVYWTIGGQAYYGYSAGSLWTSSGLYTSGSTYSVINCNSLILITKSFSPCTTCPAGESEIPGRECGTRMCV